MILVEACFAFLGITFGLERFRTTGSPHTARCARILFTLGLNWGKLVIEGRNCLLCRFFLLGFPNLLGVSSFRSQAQVRELLQFRLLPARHSVAVGLSYFRFADAVRSTLSPGGGMEKMGSYLKRVREEAGLSQGAVAKALGYNTAQFISNWERDVSMPPIASLKKLGNLYKIDAEQLFEVMLKTTIDMTTKDLERKFKASSKR